MLPHCTNSLLVRRMVEAICFDIAPYIMVYAILIVADIAFCIVNMPSNEETFGDSSTMTSGMFSALLQGWQIAILGNYNMSGYSTLVAKLVFVLFTGFGNLSAITSQSMLSTSPYC